MEEKIEESFLKASLVSSDIELDPVAFFEPGSTVLEKFLVISLLGRGGMGSVYRIKDLQLGTEFALKCLNKHHTNDIIWRRFDNEARAANRLDHPNLIKVHDSGLLPDGQPYFVMDLIDGITLAEELKMKGRLPLDEALKILIQVAFAIAYAHDNGVIHRDIKPSNIMLVNDAHGHDGSVKLVDFGIAKLTGKDEFNQLTLTRTGEIFGSPLYMSPEQCAGVGADLRSDLYSFGCVIYEVLSGAPPILADNALSTMIKHQSERPVSLKQASLGIDFPESIEIIVAKLLEKDPALRYQNAHGLAKDLIKVERHLLSDSMQKVAPRKIPKHEGQEFKLKRFLSSVSAPLVILLITIGFLLGLFTGMAIPRGTLLVDKGTNPPAELSNPDSFTLDFKADSGTKNAGVSGKTVRDEQPFSTMVIGSHSRLFHFPHESLGELRIRLEQNKRAQDLVVFDNFVPMSFAPSQYSYSHPELFSRFRSDELSDVSLRYCDENLQEILSRLVRSEKLRWLVLTTSNADDKCLPLIDKLTALRSLSVNGTAVTGGGLSKLKILPKLTDLKCADIVDIKPLIARLDQMPDLKVLDLSSDKLDRSDLIKIGRLAKVTDLDLTSTPALNDRTLSYLSSMPMLTEIDAEKCSLTPASIETFKKMRSLKQIHLSLPGWAPAEQMKLQKQVGSKCEVVFERNQFAEAEQEYQSTRTGH